MAPGAGSGGTGGGAGAPSAPSAPPAASTSAPSSRAPPSASSCSFSSSGLSVNGFSPCRGRDADTEGRARARSGGVRGCGGVRGRGNPGGAPHLQVALQLLADDFVVEDAAGHHERGLLGLLHHELQARQAGLETLLSAPESPLPPPPTPLP